MPSTYSPSLQLELIGTGDQAGTWGTTTNTNFGTLLDQAIAGYTTQAVSTGTDTTLVMTPGASAIARNMYIELTGTGGTNTNLIVPSNEKLYFIFNNTSSGQVTVKVSGQTGVSVANNTKLILVSNGTDIINATSYGTVTSVGGTGTVNGISLTGTVTSSGNLTLTGPLSGVNLTTQITGVLPVNNGGTGTSSPALVNGSGISVTGAWPNQTITATGGGGTVTSVAGTGNVNGITLTGTVTTAGNLTLGGSLSGTAAGLSIGGNAATATAASSASFATTAGTATSATTATTASAATTLSTGSWLGFQSGATLAYNYLGSPRATLDSAGNWAPSGYIYGVSLLVNTFSEAYGPAPSRCNILYSGSGENGIALKNTTTTTQNAILFVNNAGTAVGACFSSTTNTAFVTSSDYRLKNSIAPMTGALAKVALLKPCTYKWNYDNSDSQGFIAHELQEVAPDAVTGEKDGKEMQGVDYGRITPILTAALQELIAKIEVLEARVAALELR